MDAGSILYVLASLILPGLWGWFVHRLFLHFWAERSRNRPRRTESTEPHSTDLHYQI